MLEEKVLENSENQSNNLIIKKSTLNLLLAGIIGIVAIAAFFAGTYISDQNSNKLTQKDLDDAIAKLELKLMQERLPTSQPQLPAKISVDDDPIKGNPNAPITIIEFSDFECPFCARFHVNTLPQLEQNYISTGKVKFVYRDFPIQNIHPNAVPAALVSECADDQNKFWEIHDKIFETQSIWKDLEPSQAVGMFRQFASNMGLDMETFDACITSGKHLQEINNDLNDGRTYGITGTPAFFVGNDKIGFAKISGAQPFSSFQGIIEKQLGRD